MVASGSPGASRPVTTANGQRRHSLAIGRRLQRRSGRVTFSLWAGANPRRPRLAWPGQEWGD